MRQLKWGLLAVASCGLLLAGGARVLAMRIAIAPLPQRVATAESVVIGKVTSIEEKTASAPRFPGDKGRGEYRVAILKIEEAFGTARKLTHVRVGFEPPPMELAPNPGT